MFERCVLAALLSATAKALSFQEIAGTSTVASATKGASADTVVGGKVCAGVNAGTCDDGSSTEGRFLAKSGSRYKASPILGGGGGSS